MAARPQPGQAQVRRGVGWKRRRALRSAGMSHADPPVARPPVLALDIGGTKMVAGLVAGDGQVAASTRVDTPAGADAEALFDVVESLLTGQLDMQQSAITGGPVELCGIGCGGPMTRGGEAVSPLNIGGWRGFPLRSRVAALTGLPTWADNDAKALTRAEGWFGAAAGVSNFVGMVVSTGVGGGIVLDGRMLDGADGNAGHIGHMVVEPGGRPCVCGASGCLEAEASGTAIAAITGHPAAEARPATVERSGAMVGRAVASVANLLDLRLAVVAGSVALGFGDPFFAAAQAEMDRSCRLDHSRGAEIRRAGLGADAPLVGAACVAWAGAGFAPPAPSR